MRFRLPVPPRLTGRAVATPIVALAILTTFACGLEKITKPQVETEKPVFNITGDSTLALGATAAMTVSPSTGGTLNTASVLVRWETDNDAVASVDAATGVVTGKTIGTANISARLIASEFGEVTTAKKVVRVKFAGIKISTVDSLIAIGMTKVIVVRGINSSGVLQAPIEFSGAMQVVSRDAAIFDVNSAGALVAKANGTARLFVQVDGLKDSVNVKVRQVARSITFPTAVGGELAIQSLNKDRALAVTPRDSLGVAIASPSVTWSTSDATTVSVTAATGVARGLKLGTARIRATVDGKIDSITARVTQVPATLTKVAGDNQSAVVGNAVATAPLVAVLDSGNTPVPGVAVTFTVASGGGSVSGGSQTSAAGTGQAAATSWTLGTTAGANTLTAASEGASTTFTATGTPGAATKLIFSTQPTNSPTGAPLTTFRVAVADANDNVVTTAAHAITVSKASGPGTIGGTQTISAVNGVATFSAVTLSATGVYTLTATATSLAPATSNAFAMFGPATKLGFTTQPVGGTAGQTMTAFRVAIQDAAGNTVTTATNTVTIALSTGSFGAGSTVSTAAVAGVATFSNVSIAAAGTYTIGASATGLTGTTSSSVTIAAVGPPAKLAFTVHPVNGTAGAALAAIKVAIQDANGVTNTSSTAAVTLGVETGTGVVLGGGSTTVDAVAGVATFTGIVISKAGSGYRLNATSGALTKGVSNTFNVAAGQAFKLAFASSIPNAVVSAAITPPVQVQVQDQFNNLVTTATNSIAITATGGAGSLSGGTATAAVGGVATFNALALSAAGTYTLVANASGSTLQTGTSSQFSVVTETAAIKLAFITQPTNVTAGTAFNPSIQVAVQNAAGGTVSSTASVTLSIAAGPAGGTLSGTVTKAAVAGIATFDNLTLPLAGNGYQLSAAATGLTAATSASFNVAAGTPSRTAFLTHPQSATAGVPFASDLQVHVLDANNNRVTSATNTITLAYGNNPGGGGSTTLKGTLSVAAVDGVATFPGIRATRTGTGYTLISTSTGLITGTSNTFDITPGPAIGLAFRQQPFGVTAGATFNPQVQVSVADSLGNTVTTASANITLAVNSGPAGGAMGGTATQATTSGVATFADVVFQKSGLYTLAATTADFATATSNQFFISAGAATKLGFSVQPTNTFVNAPMNPGTSSVQVQVQDAFGNVVTSGSSANTPVTIGLGTIPTAGAALTGTVTANASFGTMSVPLDVEITKAGNGFTLTATAAGLTSATSTAFNVGAFSTASKLVWVTQPAGNVTGATFRAPIQVGVSDQYGNIVTSHPSTTVLIGCTSSCSTTNGSATTGVGTGIATFTNFTIGTAGTFQLSGSAGSGTLFFDALSSSFVISSGTVATSPGGRMYDVAVHGDNAYYLERPEGQGSIVKVSLTTGATSTLASGLDYPAALTTDGVNVYWVEDGSGRVKRVPVGGGSVVTMSTAQSGIQQVIQTDGSRVFIVANNNGGAADGLTANTQRQIKTLSVSAVEATPSPFYTMNCGLVASCQAVFTIVGSTVYYWRSAETSLPQGIYSVPSAGGVASTMVVSSVSQPGSLVVGNNVAYYSIGTSLLSAPVNSGTATGTSRGVQFVGTTRLGFSGTSLYSLDAGNSTIKKFNVTDFTSISLTTTTGGAETRALAFDADFVFWGDNTTPPKLRRTPK